MSQHEDTSLHSPSPSPAPYMIPPPENPPPFVPPPNLPMPADNAEWIGLLRMIAQSRQPTSFNNINMIKFSDPNKFTGKSQDVDSYVKTIESHISAAPGTFTNDFQMTTYFASWLGSGIPEKWYQGIQEFQPAILHDYPTFVQAISNHFGDPNLVETAHRQLQALQQTGLASTYVARFWELAVQCKHSDYDMCTLFTKGLKDKVQLQMLQDCPKNLNELYHLAIDIDSHLYKMKKRLEESVGQKKLPDPSSSRGNSNQPSTSSSSPYIPPPKQDPDAMEIDTLSVLDSNGKLNPAKKSH